VGVFDDAGRLESEATPFVQRTAGQRGGAFSAQEGELISQAKKDRINGKFFGIL
jgi:hypothetical protein